MLMIKNFKHKGLERFFYDGDKSGIIPQHAQKLGDILDTLDAAHEIKDMNFPGAELHLLKGKIFKFLGPSKNKRQLENYFQVQRWQCL